MYSRDRPGTIFPPGPGTGRSRKSRKMMYLRFGGNHANHKKILLDYSLNINTSFFMICAISPAPAPVSRRGQGPGDHANHEKTKHLRFGCNQANHTFL